MHRIVAYIKKLIICTLLSMLVTAITTFIIIRKFEVIPGASLFGLFILPSIFIYYALDLLHKTQKTKVIGYIIPLLAILTLFVVGLILAMNGKCSEGEDQMATLMLISILVGGTVVYFFVSKTKWLK